MEDRRRKRGAGQDQSSQDRVTGDPAAAHPGHPWVAVGLMSGTSMDGIDVAVTEIRRRGGRDALSFLGGHFMPYPQATREELLKLAGGDYGGTRAIALMNTHLAKLYVAAVREALDELRIPPERLSLIASHGQTLYHSLEEELYLGGLVQSSLQLGEGSYLAEAFGCPVVTDFRVRDIAAGGLGAPLVPFVEAELYARDDEDVVYLNIGGISNISFIERRRPATAGDSDAGAAALRVPAFDTGPGNMLIDQAMEHLSEGKLHYDEDGRFGSRGEVSQALVDAWLEDPYYRKAPPKNSGRENFGRAYFQKLLDDARREGLRPEDFVASLSALTAQVNVRAIRDFCPGLPRRLIVSGGGSRNPNIMRGLREGLPGVTVESGDVLGYPNDYKEAVAFAYLGYRCLRGEVNTLPSVTGARHPVVMGKISQ